MNEKRNLNSQGRGTLYCESRGCPVGNSRTLVYVGHPTNIVGRGYVPHLGDSGV